MHTIAKVYGNRKQCQKLFILYIQGQRVRCIGDLGADHVYDFRFSHACILEQSSRETENNVKHEVCYKYKAKNWDIYRDYIMSRHLLIVNSRNVIFIT